MPTYEYACKSCGEHLEVVQSFKDDPLSVCTACGGPVRRVFSPIGIAFKGSGFYRNDSRSSSSGSRSRSHGSSGDSGSSSSSSSEGTKASEGSKPAEGSSAGGSSSGSSAEKSAAAS